MGDAAPQRGQRGDQHRQDTRPFADRVAENRSARLAALPGRRSGSTAGSGADARHPEPEAAAVTLAATGTFGVTTMIALLVLALIPPVLLGWTATVIESSSMQPTIVRGDIVVLRPIEDRAAVGAVVRFPSDDGGSSIVHRVVEVDREAAAYVTKGDANRDDDQALVPFENVDGLGTILIPLIGHPALWFQEGDRLTFTLMILAGVGIVLGGLGAAERRSTTAEDGARQDPAPETKPTPGPAVPILGGPPLGPWSTGGRRHHRVPAIARRQPGWGQPGSP